MLVVVTLHFGVHELRLNRFHFGVSIFEKEKHLRMKLFYFVPFVYVICLFLVFLLVFLHLPVSITVLCTVCPDF